MDYRAAELLHRGMQSSPTFARLLDALSDTDVIVHIEHARMSAPDIAGETRFVTSAGGHRYLRIAIAPWIADDVAVSMLAHELYHVWEIAQARWVRDADHLHALYRAIGDTREHGGMTLADSPGAKAAGVMVRAEVRAFD